VVNGCSSHWIQTSSPSNRLVIAFLDSILDLWHRGAFLLRTVPSVAGVGRSYVLSQNVLRRAFVPNHLSPSLLTRPVYVFPVSFRTQLALSCRWGNAPDAVHWTDRGGIRYCRCWRCRFKPLPLGWQHSLTPVVIAIGQSSLESARCGHWDCVLITLRFPFSVWPHRPVSHLGK